MGKLQITKIELGLQSNNKYHNIPSIFITVSGCNLKCMRGNNICRFAFTEHIGITLKEIKKFINDNKQINHIVIKGGEPLMYKEELEKLLNDIWRDGMKITIHTNGTLPILNPLSHKYRISLYVVNLSKKTFPEPGSKITIPSTGKPFVFGTNDIEQMQSINIDNLRNLCLYSSDYLLNFSAEPENIVEYSNDILKQICTVNEEFLERFLKTHSPYTKTVYVPMKKSDIDSVKKICYQQGVMFGMFNTEIRK